MRGIDVGSGRLLTLRGSIVNVSVRSRDNTLLMYEASHVGRVEARLSVVLIEDLLPLDSRVS